MLLQQPTPQGLLGARPEQEGVGHGDHSTPTGTERGHGELKEGRLQGVRLERERLLRAEGRAGGLAPGGDCDHHVEALGMPVFYWALEGVAEHQARVMNACQKHANQPNEVDSRRDFHAKDALGLHTFPLQAGVEFLSGVQATDALHQHFRGPEAGVEDAVARTWRGEVAHEPGDAERCREDACVAHLRDGGAHQLAEDLARATLVGRSLEGKLGDGLHQLVEGRGTPEGLGDSGVREVHGEGALTNIREPGQQDISNVVRERVAVEVRPGVPSQIGSERAHVVLVVEDCDGLPLGIHQVDPAQQQQRGELGEPARQRIGDLALPPIRGDPQRAAENALGAGKGGAHGIRALPRRPCGGWQRVDSPQPCRRDPRQVHSRRCVDLALAPRNRVVVE